jgi:hypothetical protein
MNFLRTKIAFFVITACAFALAVIVGTELYIANVVTKVTSSVVAPVSRINQTTEYDTITSLTENYTFYSVYHIASNTFIWLGFARSLFRDLVMLILLIAFNILILLEIKKMTRRRLSMASERSNQGIAYGARSSASRSVRSSLRAERP